MDEVNQEEYCIIILKDNSVKIGKIRHDLSPPKLKRSTANIHPDIYSVSEFSKLFQILMSKNILNTTNNPNNINLPFVKENHETFSSLLPIVIDQSIGIDYSDPYPLPSSDEEDLKKVPERPKLSRASFPRSDYVEGENNHLAA